jgi:class 3 adenylate cyclase
VAGYSRLMGEDEEGTHERLKAHLRELVDPKIKEHRGRIVKNTGDGMLAEFRLEPVYLAVDRTFGALDRCQLRAHGRVHQFVQWDTEGPGDARRLGHRHFAAACQAILGQERS